ncbi:hypothetical protein EV182_000144 [Spiromyces aspiralis]|uniref:Uncharacterized protein n=1 Tax=Spiromyces aspiralis TaxID=68401 RepID=A0ACC1HV81_9FUNG|nr:hypothetical protein EV182_000144 [Spiromyces aspiralis]
MSSEDVPQLIMRIQERMIQSQRQLATVEAQLTLHQREARKSELTLRELASLDPDTPMYRSVGKMFLREDRSEIQDQLQKQQREAKDTVLALEKKKKYFEREAKEANDNLMDVLRSSRGGAGSS